MISFDYRLWSYVTTEQKVGIRVYWGNKFRVTFITDVYVQKDKWDPYVFRAMRGAPHFVKTKDGVIRLSPYQINDRLDDFEDAIHTAFTKYALNNSIPEPNDLKTMVNDIMGRSKKKDVHNGGGLMTLKEMSERFITETAHERNWSKQNENNSRIVLRRLFEANPMLTVRSITEKSMIKLRDYYVELGIRNDSINKEMIRAKLFMKWLSEIDGVNIPQKVLDYKTNLKTVRKTVTFLHYNELMAFADFKFGPEDKQLKTVRDIWCFMAFTSLRYSDVKTLKHAHIQDGRVIQKLAIKTGGQLTIPLTSHAKKILDKYKDIKTKNGTVFDVLNNKSFNNYLKAAAKKAGLNREIVNTYYIGTKRYEEVKPFHEIITSHDARRTFVSCSLAMGITPEVVMKCTGHSSYKAMRPYIETATETQFEMMEKWDKNTYRSEILSFMEKANDEELKHILEVTKSKVVDKEDVLTKYDAAPAEPLKKEEKKPEYFIFGYNGLMQLLDMKIHKVRKITEGRLLHSAIAMYGMPVVYDACKVVAILREHCDQNIVDRLPEIENGRLVGTKNELSRLGIVTHR